MGIVSEDVRKVAETTDLVALVEEFTDVKRSGRNFTALCPFHEERTPSFSISAEKGVYHCFGCGVSGDSISFAREKMGLDFVEAVEILAKKSGVQLHYTEDKEGASHSQKLKLKEAVKKAAEMYHSLLLNADSAGPARSYLRSRGYEKETIEKWQLGWAPVGGEEMQKLGVSSQMLLDAGLSLKSNRGDGREIYDYFRSRILFPICDSSGSPIAFGGRILPGSEGNGPKYLNSRDSQIYQKSYELYGQHLAREHIVSQQRAVVVEGYTDVIGLEAIGIKESVATCGTSLTVSHLRTLKKFTSQAVLAFDPDLAGTNSMLRSFEDAKEAALDLKAAALPQGKDPGQLAAENPETMKSAIESALPLLQFTLDRFLDSRGEDSREERQRLCNGSAEIIFRQAQTQLLANEYVNYAAQQIGVEDDEIMRQIAEHKKNPGRKYSRPVENIEVKTEDVVKPNPNSVEHMVLLLAVHTPEIIPDYIDERFFEFSLEKEAFSALLLDVDSFQEACDAASPKSADLLRSLANTEIGEGKADSFIARLITRAVERYLFKQERRLQELEHQKQDANLGYIAAEDIKKQILEIDEEVVEIRDSLSKVENYGMKLDTGKHPAADLIKWT